MIYVSFKALRKCFLSCAKTNDFPILKQNYMQFSQNETVLVTLAVSRDQNKPQ